MELRHMATEPIPQPADQPDNLVLVHLPRLDERLTQPSKDMLHGFQTVTGHLIGLTGRMVGIETRLDAMESWSADTTARLERIERRLELSEAAG
jgi:hypothetical protein